jgi:hypothetical protein
LLPDPSPEKALLPVVDDDNVKLATIDDNANDSVAFKVVDDSTTKEKKAKKEKKLKKVSRHSRILFCCKRRFCLTFTARL